MEILVLGCGSSVGVPSVSCKCTVCASLNVRNMRSRSSIMLSLDGFNVLIDTSPDLRYQALRYGVTTVNAVIYTHRHFDHYAGINDLVAFEKASSYSAIEIYSDAVTADYLFQSNAYLFEEVVFEQNKRNYLILNVKDYYDPFFLPGIKDAFILTEQQHGKIKSSGVIVGNFAYCTDFNDMSEKSLLLLQEANLELIFIECLRYSKSIAHINFEECLTWLDKIRPKRAFLTHMSHEIEYETFVSELLYYSKQLKIDIMPSYDGLKVVV